jgi:hypothetical protein
VEARWEEVKFAQIDSLQLSLFHMAVASQLVFQYLPGDSMDKL